MARASIAARRASPSAYDPMRSTASSGPRTSCSASRIRYESSARRTRMGPSRSTPVPRARSDVRARAMSVPIDGSDDRVAVPVKWRLPTETLARPLGRAAGVWSPRTDRTAQPRRPQTTRSGERGPRNGARAALARRVAAGDPRPGQPPSSFALAVSASSASMTRRGIRSARTTSPPASSTSCRNWPAQTFSNSATTAVVRGSQSAVSVSTSSWLRRPVMSLTIGSK